MDTWVMIGIVTIFMVSIHGSRSANHSLYHIPDEQRLYRALMWGYENSARPVFNANHTVIVNFRLTLNQIIDLDERQQVLTTNVFIDQTWTDENLMWDPRDYNNIKTLRVHEKEVWLPDTFLFNNADEGSTGFMRGMYVLLNSNGTVLWPVPVKLKSSCKVNIAYFPFDDQLCQWRFGSWIYSGSWIDFHSSLDDVDLLNFIDNSEWELISVKYEKNYHINPASNDGHPDLLFTLHIRRRTLFYIFNIIAPCVMLSVLTLLTFWLPTTSGEKISLGLSVFLAFSMFMLLIAEEVPATSNSVPLIGIYLTTVMTMTSVSVIMAVMVINLYNRGSQAVHAPKWLRVLVLEGLSRILCLKHDIDKLTDNIKLDKEEEAKYACVAHPPVLSRRSKFRRSPSTSACSSPSPSPPLSPQPSPPLLEHVIQNDFKVKVSQKTNQLNDMSNHKIEGHSQKKKREVSSAYEDINKEPNQIHLKQQSKFRRKRSFNHISPETSFFNVNGIASLPTTVIPQITVTDVDDREEYDDEPDSPVWIKRDSVIKREREQLIKYKEEKKRYHENSTQIINTLQPGSRGATAHAPPPPQPSPPLPVLKVTSPDAKEMTADGSGGGNKVKSIPLKVADVLGTDETPCNKKQALLARRQIVVEWQTIATVIDRLLFWIFLAGTLVAYLVILFLIPYTKPNFYEGETGINILHRSRHSDVVFDSKSL